MFVFRPSRLASFMSILVHDDGYWSILIENKFGRGWVRKWNWKQKTSIHILRQRQIKVTNTPADKNTADKNTADKNPIDENPTDKNLRLPNSDKKPAFSFFVFFCGKKYGVVTLFTYMFPTNSHRLKQFANELNDRGLRATLNEQSLIATAQATPVGIALVLFAFLRSESSPES